MDDPVVIGPLEFKAAIAAVERHWESQLGVTGFASANTEYNADAKMMMKRDIRLPGNKYESDILFSLGLTFQKTPKQVFAGTRVTTYYQKVAAYLHYIEISKVLDFSIPSGLLLLSPYVMSKDSKSTDLVARTIDIKVRGKKIKRNNLLKDFIEAEKQRYSWFTTTLKRTANQADTWLVNSYRKNQRWADPLFIHFQDAQMVFIPFWGKTIIRFLFVPYPSGGHLISDPHSVLTDGIPRDVSNWHCHKEMMQAMFHVMSRAEEIAEQFRVGGTQTADASKHVGLVQYEIMELAKERYLPNEPPISMDDTLYIRDNIAHLRTALDEEVSKGPWGIIKITRKK